VARCCGTAAAKIAVFAASVLSAPIGAALL
jgi:hypothetical protein